MKRTLIIAAAAFALAACGQSTTTEEAAAPETPQDMMSEVQAMAPEDRGVFAWRQLTAYQQANPDVQPPCTSLRQVDAVGVIPENVNPQSIYAAHVGSLVYTVQCGPQLTTVRPDPREHWMIVFAPGAAEPVILPCSPDGGRSQCLRVPQTVDPAPATP
ncbi:MAG: hypothetical protein R3C16_05155 [Hyphomonadaceae bacterium]